MGKVKQGIIGIEIELLEETLRKIVREELEETLSNSRFVSEFKDEVWTRKDVADFLKTTPENITASFNKKEIPGKKVGREYRFLKSQIVGMFKKGKL